LSTFDQHSVTTVSTQAKCL